MSFRVHHQNAGQKLNITMDSLFYREFIDQSIYRMEENTPRIIKCTNLLTEAEIWQRPNENSNSVGNLILHLCGNITQYVHSSLGNRPDTRERDAEFIADSGPSKNILLGKLEQVVDEANSIIRKTPIDELLRLRKVQGFSFTGIGIVIHVVEHYSYHTGQIAFWTKLLKNKDLSFYGGINLNLKNEIK